MTVNVFSRWLSQVRETTSSLLQLSLDETVIFLGENRSSGCGVFSTWAVIGSPPGTDCHASVAGDRNVGEGRILRQRRQHGGVSKPEESRTNDREASR